MIYSSEEMEMNAVLDTAQLMCTAARTAPKTCGIDKIKTLVLTGEDKQALADKLEEVDIRRGNGTRSFLSRDAENARKAQAVVLIGIRRETYGLNCGYCGYDTCGACVAGSGLCFFAGTDLGIAVGSAVSAAADLRVDNRVMFSLGRAAAEMDLPIEGKCMWLGIPLSVGGKNPFFDRK